MYRPVTPCIGSGLPFRVGQSLNPYPNHYRPGIRFFQHLLPASPFFLLTKDRLHTWREIQAYHVPHDSQISCFRTPLYTDRVFRCVGSPSKLANLPDFAILALGPNGSSSLAPFTIRNSKASLTLPIPTIPQGSDGVLLAA